MHRLMLVLVTTAGCSDSAPAPLITDRAVATCAPDPAFAEVEVEVQGRVIDLVTGAPHAGVTVDIARAWEPEAVFPATSCSLRRLTTDADGRFGPVVVGIG